MSTEQELQKDQDGDVKSEEPKPAEAEPVEVKPEAPVPDDRKQGSSTLKAKLKAVLFLLVLAAVAAAAVMTSVSTIPPGHVGVVLRFGKYAGIHEPGLALSLPFRIDRIVDLESDRVMTESFGFRSTNPGAGRARAKDSASVRESTLVTGDMSVIGLEWTVQYKCGDPEKYLFSLHDPVQTLRDTGEEAMRAVAGDASLDYVIVNRDALARECGDKLQASLDALGSGIRITGVSIQNVIPPEPVKPAFDEVNTARQERDRLVQEALADYNREIPKARGEASAMVSEAQGYAVETVNRAAGEAARFNSLLSEYRGAREVTKRRLYLDACRDVMPRAHQVIVIDGKNRDILPKLNLEKSSPRTGGSR